ncbi:MAG: response regulator transcription factor [Lautropia sp.]
MTPLDQAVDDLILRLYRGSTEVSFARFQDWSLDLLGGVVRFDAAWWGKANAEPNKILSVHLLNADPSILDDYRKIDAIDSFRDAMLAQPGTTINLSDLMSRKDFERSPIYSRYGRKHRVEAVVGTVLVEPVSSMLDFLTIWRFDPRWPFSEVDRQIIERVTPHLIEANRISRLVSLQGEKFAVSPLDPIRPWALASNDDGCLLEVNASFVALAKREWPDWRSAVLPTALRRQFRQCEPYVGDAIIVNVSNVDGFRLLVARPRKTADRLGNRESEVLKRYASGQSHREIANALGTSPATVRNQLARIYRKFGVHNKIELINAVYGTAPADAEAPAAPAIFSSAPPAPLAELLGAPEMPKRSPATGRDGPPEDIGG